MQPRPQAFQFLASASLCCAPLGCRNPIQEYTPGATDPGELATRRTEGVQQPARVEPSPWEPLAELSAWPIARDTFETKHLTPLRQARIRTNSVAQQHYPQLVRDTAIPRGGIIIELLHSEATQPWSLAFVMEKTADGWLFGTIDANNGTFQPDPSGLCARCHHDAVADQLFGIPAAAAPALNANP